jgi:pimeloyl-ACP methyl ester carboxylesterase
MSILKKWIVFSLVCGFLIGTSVQAKEVSLTLNGQTLNADLVMAKNKTLKDGVVLFTHGTWMNNQYSTAKMVKTNLPEAGLNVLAINLSLGQNNRHNKAIVACDKMQSHRHTDALKEIGAWVQWLEQQGVNNITLMGHSRGGNQTAWYASLHNSDPIIKHIVLLAPQLWNAQTVKKDYKKKYHKDLMPLLAKAKKMVQAGKGNELMPHTDFVYCPNIAISADRFVDYYQVNPKMDTLYLLPKIKKPVLVFSGTEDTVIHHLAQKMKPIIRKYKNIQTYEVQDATHSFTDFAGEEVAQQILHFTQH